MREGDGQREGVGGKTQCFHRNSVSAERLDSTLPSCLVSFSSVPDQGYPSLLTCPDQPSQRRRPDRAGFTPWPVDFNPFSLEVRRSLCIPPTGPGPLGHARSSRHSAILTPRWPLLRPGPGLALPRTRFPFSHLTVRRSHVTLATSADPAAATRTASQSPKHGSSLLRTQSVICMAYASLDGRS